MRLLKSGLVCILFFMCIFVIHQFNYVFISFWMVSFPYHFPDTPNRNSTRQIIPNIIHFTWKNNDISTYSSDPTLRRWNETYAHLGYEIKLWTDAQVLEIIEEYYPSILDIYLAYPFNIQRADIARLVILHQFGGIYSDLDVKYPRDH